MGGAFDAGLAGDTFEARRGRRATAPPPASTEPEIEMGCICGYSCGTQAALNKHLARFPGDPSHAAQIKEVPAAPPKPTAAKPASETPSGLGCSCGYTCGTMAALARHCEK